MSISTVDVAELSKIAVHYFMIKHIFITVSFMKMTHY